MPLKGHYVFHSLRARGAFLVSSEFRDGKAPYVLVMSLGGRPCRVINPFDEGEEVVVRDLTAKKAVAEFPAAKQEQAIDFKTVADHTYVVERKNLQLEQVPVITK